VSRRLPLPENISKFGAVTGEQEFYTGAVIGMIPRKNLLFQRRPVLLNICTYLTDNISLNERLSVMERILLS
jgi:hypothetical protein